MAWAYRLSEIRSQDAERTEDQDGKGEMAEEA